MNSNNPFYTIGIDFGGTKILAALVDDSGCVLNRHKTPTKASRGPSAVIETLCSAVRALIKSSSVDMDAVSAVGIGVPGSVDVASGTVLFAPNLTGWKDIPLKKLLEHKLGKPVVVDNDVNTGTFGEFSAGDTAQASMVVGVFIGTGIGGGIIMDGAVYHGASNSAGEIGHMKISTAANAPVCGCGNKGCLEAFAGKIGIQNILKSRIGKKKTGRLAEALTTDGVIKSSVLAALVKEGDETVIKVLSQAAEYIGFGISNIIHCVNPDIIIVGGGVIEAMEDFMMPLITDAVKRHTLPASLPKTRIRPSLLMDDAVVVGAACMARSIDSVSSATPSVIKTAQALMEAYDWEIEHQKHVTELSLALFDSLQDMHGMDAHDRTLLHTAAILHDIGFSVSEKAHHKHSAKLILKEKLPGLTDEEKNIVAVIARYHRKALPKKGHKIMSKLSKDTAGKAMKLAAILRIADGLDRTHMEAVSSIAWHRSGDTITFSVTGEPLLDADIEGAEKKKDLFETAFSCKVVIEPASP